MALATGHISTHAHLHSPEHSCVECAGTLGTLTELCAIWNISALGGEGHAIPPAIIAYREPWHRLIEVVVESLGISSEYAACVQYVDTAEEAARLCEVAHAAAVAKVAAAAAGGETAAFHLGAAPAGGAAAVPAGGAGAAAEGRTVG